MYYNANILSKKIRFSESVLKLILELCETPNKTNDNLREVNIKFEKIIENIFPCASPTNSEATPQVTSNRRREFSKSQSVSFEYLIHNPINLYHFRIHC